jgi:hypothetical protein
LVAFPIPRNIADGTDATFEKRNSSMVCSFVKVAIFTIIFANRFHILSQASMPTNVPIIIVVAAVKTDNLSFVFVAFILGE